MSSAQVVGDNHVVSIHYTLRGDDGAVIDSSQGSEPLDYLHGHDGIVPGLEAAITGRTVGDRFQVKVAAKDGYGEAKSKIEKVPRDAFPDDMELEVGMQIFAQGPRGNPVPLWIARIEDDAVHVDQTHPLSGKNLHFEVEIVGIRAASADELEHGHPHGPDGHGHHH